MSTLDQQTIDSLLKLDTEQRYQHLITQVVQTQTLWLLTDETGCVMLNTDEEDCIPVWPNQEFAERWATQEWEKCQSEPIALKTWQHRWTPGLTDDNFYLVVFPDEQQQGTVIHPEDFAADLRKALKKHNQSKK